VPIVTPAVVRAAVGYKNANVLAPLPMTSKIFNLKPSMECPGTTLKNWR